ncbi:MAG TPA: G1 family glutamic endopeptidase, partial [Chloroflexota bacterium]|nr:G1 family glutamic endopeptidase [Chloroflexota bacterium]
VQVPCTSVKVPPPGQAASRNWSGYAATGGTFTEVHGTWTVPQPGAASAPGVSAAWVGIGGVDSRDLIQAGTEETVTGTGQRQYEAWIETLPQAAETVPLTVRPGDTVTVDITEQGADTWLVSITNKSTGQKYQRPVRYASSRSSVEWVEEAPSAGRGGVLPIDDFGTVSFTGATAVKNGKSVTLSQLGAGPITMIGPSGQALAVPSAIGGDGASFSVTRTAAPATATPGQGQGGGFPTYPGPGRGRRGN